MVIVYKESSTNWHVLGSLINVDNYGLVNLIAGRTVATELMQHDCNGERMAKELVDLLDPQRNASLRAELRSVTEKLGDAGASTRAAEKILCFIESTTT
jgi:lipid-A-disaccharide synthase